MESRSPFLSSCPLPPATTPQPKEETLLEKCEVAAFKVEESAKAARTFRTGALRLARFARRVSNLVSLHYTFREGNGALNDQDKNLQPAYDALLAALQTASACAKHHSIAGFLKASELKDQFSKWPETVLEALSLFEDSVNITDTGMKQEFEEEVTFLKNQITSVTFVDQEMERTCSLLQSFEAALDALCHSPEFEKIIGMLTDLSQEMNFSIMDLIEIQDIYSSRPDWLGKGTFTEEHLVLVQMALSRVLRQKSDSSQTKFDLIPDLPLSFKCPISMELMTDPVVLAESGQIYDRQSINKWFVTGKSTCPVTGKRLVSTQLIPVHSLKSDIQEFIKRYNITSTNSKAAKNNNKNAITNEASFSFGGTEQNTNRLSVPDTVFPPLDFSFFSQQTSSSQLRQSSDTSLVPEVHERQQLIVNVIAEECLQHMQLDQLRYFDYCAHGYQRLTADRLPEEVRNEISTDSEMKYFSIGVRPTLRGIEEGDQNRAVVGGASSIQRLTNSTPSPGVTSEQQGNSVWRVRPLSVENISVALPQLSPNEMNLSPSLTEPQTEDHQEEEQEYPIPLTNLPSPPPQAPEEQE